MQRFKNMAVYLLVLALSAAAALKSDPLNKIQGKAVVKTVSGTGAFSFGGSWAPLKQDEELDAGTTIKSGPESDIYLSLNGSASALHLIGDTTLAIAKMDRNSSTRHADTQTILDLKIGRILGQVKKLSTNSSYVIKTPHGMAAIRHEADFEISVQQLPDGNYSATFTSLKGVFLVSAVVNGFVQIKPLHDRQSWTPGEGDVHPKTTR
jgi:hypothetical protein